MSKKEASNVVQPPKAARIEQHLTIHNDTRIDPYFWLKDRDNSAVIDYLNAENAFTEAQLKHTSTLQTELFNEMKARIKEEDESVPFFSNGYFYYHRFEAGKEYPFHCRKKMTLSAPEELFLDVNDLAKNHSYYQVGERAVSANNEWLAFGEDTVSRRLFTLKFKNLVTGQILEECIPNTTGSAAWAADNKTVFYTLKEVDSLRAYKIMRHVLGTSVAEDVEIFEEKDETFFCGTYLSNSAEMIMIYSWSTLSSEFQFLKVTEPQGKFKVIQPRLKSVEYEPEHFGEYFYIKTNADKATNFKLVKAPIQTSTIDHWEEVIPHQEDVLLEDISIFKDFLVVSERTQGITEIRVLPWKDFNSGYTIQWPEAAHTVALGTNKELNTHLVRIIYTSMTTPQSVIDFNMLDKSSILLKEREVMGDFDKAHYESEWVFITARDGVKVPMSIVYRKGFKKDGSQPFLLYAYGSYGHSVDPQFSPNRLSLLDRGFGFAIAHIRGGEEMGRKWYEDGKLLNKKNTFNDFIDCGKWLVEQQYVAPNQLFAMGGSAGGLLMGAIINQEPSLWKGVVAAVPFVDVITTMLDDTIPLTTFEYDEWGNPNDKTYYEYIKSYSPYDNVEAKDYPNLLVTTGLQDSQVQYWEPAKWVAKLRALKTDKNRLLLKTNMEAGHGGASGRFEPLKEVALEYAFMLELVGETT
jgi:oligopeptidase B